MPRVFEAWELHDIDQSDIRAHLALHGVSRLVKVGCLEEVICTNSHGVLAHESIHLHCMDYRKYTDIRN